jgi:hypothetical protein
LSYILVPALYLLLCVQFVIRRLVFDKPRRQESKIFAVAGCGAEHAEYVCTCIKHLEEAQKKMRKRATEKEEKGGQNGLSKVPSDDSNDHAQLFFLIILTDN